MPDSTHEAHSLAFRPTIPQTPEISALANQVLADAKERITKVLLKDPRAGRSKLSAALGRVMTSRDVPNLASRTQALGNAESARPVLTQLKATRPGKVSSVESVAKARRVVDFKVKRDDLMHELAGMAKAKGWDQLAKFDPATTQLDPDLVAGLKFNKLRMFVTEVRCREETDESGSDHILIGGTRTNYLGDTFTVNQWTVSSAISTGQKRSFGLSKVFASWNLAKDPTGFPYVYTAVVVLAEHDDGGFSDLVKEIWNLVDTQVKAAIGGLVGAAIGSALGPLGAVLGALVGALVGVLIDWFLSIIGENQDDLIDIEVVTMPLGACTKSYYDWAKLTSPGGWKKTLFMWGDGGRYEVDVAFKVFA